MGNENIKQKKINNILVLLFAIALLLILAKQISSISFRYLQVMDETHSYGATKLFFQGENPYLLKYYPDYFNMYGIIYPYLCAKIAIVFGLSIQLMREINAIALFMILGLFYVSFKKEIREKPYLSSLLLLLLFNGLMWGWNSVARPDIVGTLFYCLTFLIPCINKYSIPSLILSILFALISFYTKIYFFSGAVFLFLLLVNLKLYQKASLYAIMLIILGGISAYLINYNYPLYFYMSLFNGVGKIGSMTDSIKKIVSLAIFISPIILLFTSSFRNIRFNIIWKNPFFFLAFFAFVLLIYLGSHSGGSLNYHLQLLLPLIIAGLLYDCSFSLKVKINYLMIFSVIVFIGEIILQKPYLMQNRDTTAWESIENYLKDKKNVLNSPLIAGILIDSDKKIYESGARSNLFAESFVQRDITKKLFGLDSLIEIRKDKYFSDIKKQAKLKKFDAIVIDKGYFKIYGLDINQYKLVSKKELFIPKSNLSFPIEIYEPK